MDFLNSKDFYYKIALITVIIVFIEIVLGSYVEGIDAGMSCPQWPLCYGQLIPLNSSHFYSYTATQVWSEYVHRIVASLVSILLVFEAYLTYIHKNEITANQVPIGKNRFNIMIIILILLVLQVILGALTVLSNTDPLIVSSHLAVGTLIFGGTIYLYTKISPQKG